MTKKFFQKKEYHEYKHHERKIKLKTEIKKTKKKSLFKNKVLDFDKVLKVLFGITHRKGSNCLTLNSKKQKKNELFDINNFLSHNVTKITEKCDNALIKIECPKFRELTDKEMMEYDKTVNLKENVTDKLYIKYHKVFEEKELQYRLIEKINKKKTTKNKNNKSGLGVKGLNNESINSKMENGNSSRSYCSLNKKEQCLLSFLSLSESIETAYGDKM